MGWFKKDKVIDLSARYKREKGKTTHTQKEPPEDYQVLSPNPTLPATASGFGFLGSIANSISTSKKEEEPTPITNNSEEDERKRRLAKRLADMTDKIEELSNQIYHLQQRIELLERKTNVNKLE